MTRDRLIILGIDALDWGYVERRRGSCATLAAWPVYAPLAVRSSHRTRSRMDRPSSPAADPGDHGCLDSIDHPTTTRPPASDDRGKRAFCPTTRSGTSRLQRGHARVHGEPVPRVPAWEVNGVMIAGPVFVDGSASITGIDPRSAARPCRSWGNSRVPDSATRSGRFVEQTAGAPRVARQTSAAGSLAQTAPRPVLHEHPDGRPDDALRRRYVDPEDPTFPGRNPHEHADDRMYALIDRIAGQFAAAGRRAATSATTGTPVAARAWSTSTRRCGARAWCASRRPVTRLRDGYLMERGKKLTLRTAYELGQRGGALPPGAQVPGPQVAEVPPRPSPSSEDSRSRGCRGRSGGTAQRGRDGRPTRRGHRRAK